VETGAPLCGPPHGRIFPEVDRAVQDDLNAIAVTVKDRNQPQKLVSGKSRSGSHTFGAHKPTPPPSHAGGLLLTFE
jgi:hypothetical protein